jgi:hypothetical protein
MTYHLTMDDTHHGKMVPNILPLVKSSIVAVTTNRYVHIAIVTVVMTLVSLTLVGLSLDFAFSQMQQQQIGRSVIPHF